MYVHGGGFRCGVPGPKEGPSFFMDEDVILVTVQYRVGTLGIYAVLLLNLVASFPIIF